MSTAPMMYLVYTKYIKGAPSSLRKLLNLPQHLAMLWQEFI